MVKKCLLMFLYLAITLALSSVDITYEWYSPLNSESGERIDWYAVSGLRAGAFIWGNHDAGPAVGFESGWHLPQFPFLPFLVIGGPEGGGIYISVWLLGGIVCLIHIFGSSRAKRAATSQL